eukprot:TRINITY_DN8607_c0_g1_i1.p1 TRINITY_DN8607_c0_g1~~TRINITY_DN8607_c0_g1_i1.p1  ORF type:complete len:642 (-),score=116.64 TRINITY_DN8607_c0_g1_i1:49-1974(-)
MDLRQRRNSGAAIPRRLIQIGTVVTVLIFFWLLYTPASVCNDCQEKLKSTDVVMVSSGSAVTASSGLRVGFLLVATKMYIKFARDMISSAKGRLLTNHEVHFFVWTDATAAEQKWASNSARIHFIEQSSIGWPFDSLGRDHLYYRDRHLWSSMDYVFAIDSDVLFVGAIGDEILGDRVATLAAWFYGMPGTKATYETRRGANGIPLSTAFIPVENRQCYFAGGWFGGRHDQMLHMLKTMSAQITTDLLRTPPVIAAWHDESHVNRYFVDYPPTHVLSPGFLFPEPDGDRMLWDRPAIWGTRSSPTVVVTALNTGVRKAFLAHENLIRPPSVDIPAFMLDGKDNGRPLRVLQPANAHVDMTLDVTFVVKTFERPDCLRRLVASIPQRYRNVRVLIVDDSRAPIKDPPASHVIQYHWVGFDVGLSAGRNELVRLVETEYLLLLDDDFVFNDETRIEWLLDVARADAADIIGGCIEGEQSSFSLERPLRQQSLLRVTESVRCHDPASNVGYPVAYNSEQFTCWRTDMVNNFFLASKAALERVLWDPQLKLGEHEDFFLRVKALGLRVVACSGVRVANDHACLPKVAAGAYADKRGRVYEYWVYMFKKWGLKTMRTEAGEYRLVCSDDEQCRIDYDQKNVWWNDH